MPLGGLLGGLMLLLGLLLSLPSGSSSRSKSNSSPDIADCSGTCRVVMFQLASSHRSHLLCFLSMVMETLQLRNKAL